MTVQWQVSEAEGRSGARKARWPLDRLGPGRLSDLDPGEDHELAARRPFRCRVVGASISCKRKARGGLGHSLEERRESVSYRYPKGRDAAGGSGSEASRARPGGTRPMFADRLL